MKRQIIVGLLVSAGAANAAQRPQDFAYGMGLKADGHEALYEVVLPAAVYRSVAHADLADVRVFNSNGEVVPHAWRPRRTTEIESAIPVALTLFPLKAEEGTDINGISIHVRRSADGESSIDVTSSGARAGSAKRTVGYLVDLTMLHRALRAIALEWPSGPDGFAGKIRVDASDDLDSWRTLVGEAPLVSLEVAGQRLQQKRVELPPQNVRYLRLSWVSPSAGETVPELVSASGEPVDTIIEAAREWTKVEAEKDKKPGEYVFDLRGHYPVDRVRVHLPEPNTVAQVEWLVRDRVDQPWRSVAYGVAYRLRRGDSEIASPEVTLGVATERYWLLRVDQRGGGIGSRAPRLEVGWVPDVVVFAARGKPPFQLAYGNRDAKPTAYAIETLIPGYGSSARISAARVGAQETVNVSSARAFEQQKLGGEARLREAIDWKRWSLWGSLVLGVLLLGGMAWRLMRQVGSGDGPPPPSSDVPKSE